MKKERYNIAVVGATGAVGQEMLSVLEERAFPVDKLLPLASERSIGKTVAFNGKDIHVHELKKDSFKGVDIALFSAGGKVSKEFVPCAADSGAVAIDNTSVFRMEDNVPLVVPEVNSYAVKEYSKRGIISNPNCSTIQLVVVLKPIHDAVKIKRVVVSTYQATSGAGRMAMEELSTQVRALFAGQQLESAVFPHQIAFNCIPHIDEFMPNGYTKEEIKVMHETKKIIGDNSIKVTATAVRVPVFCGHSESVNIETERHLSAKDAMELLRKSPGIIVADDPKNKVYPMAIDVTGEDATYVGRIREDDTVENGLNCWIVADNLRKGAALNAVQIAEILIRDYL